MLALPSAVDDGSRSSVRALSIRVWPARGHAIGRSGNADTGHSTSKARVIIPSEQRSLADSERSRFIDQVLQKIRRANAEKSQPINDDSGERQQIEISREKEAA